MTQYSKQLSGLVLLAVLNCFNPAIAAIPSVTPIPSSDAFIGEQVCVSTNFSNTGTPGFGPYINITLTDGLVLDSVSIIGIGLPATPIGVIDGVTPVFDPISGIQILATPISNVFQVIPPIGSVVENGPILEFEICASLQTSLIAGQLQEISVTPGFKFGDTPTGVNGPIYEPFDQQTSIINPTVELLSKISTAPEDERPPGSSFPFDYHLQSDIADGSTLDNVHFIDVLDPTLQWTGSPIVLTATGGTNCSIDSSPNLPPVSGGTLEITCDSVLGSSAAVDLEVVYTVYITDILDENANNPQQLINNHVDMDYDYLGDPLTDQAEVNVTAKVMPIQKSAAPSPVLPGADVNFNLNIQYTDYPGGGLSVETFSITDVLPDGLSYNPGSSNLTVGGVNLGAIIPTVTPGPNPGETTLVFSSPLLTAIANGQSASITYSAKVVDYANGDPILAGDAFNNTAASTYELLGPGTGGDNSSAGVTIFEAQLVKTITDPSPLPPFLLPGESVTFHFKQTIPPGNIGSLILVDFVPLPVFDVSLFNPVTDWTLLGPAGFPAPTVSVDTAANSIAFEFGTLDEALSLQIDLELTLTIVDTPFADDLSLTNIAVTQFTNSTGDFSNLVDIVGINVAAPALEIHKGVLSTDNPVANIVPPPGNPSMAAVDGDVSGVDGNDLIDFMLTVENIGNAPAFQVTIKDPAVSGLNCSLPSAGDVTDGTGTQLAFTAGVNWDAGIVLSAPLAPTDGTPGTSFSTDTALITVHCSIDPLVQFAQVIDNTATAIWAASQTTATFFPEIEESAQLSIASPSVVKSVIDITPGYTSTPPYNTNASRRVSIGERVRWRVEMTLPEGQMNNVNFLDRLSTGLAFVENTLVITPSSGDVTSSLGFPTVLTNANYKDSGALPVGTDRLLEIGPANNAPGMGNLSNTNSDNGVTETLVMEYETIVLNWASNNNGNTRRNRADFNFDNPAGGRTRLRTNGPRVQIREPALRVAKTFSTNTGDAGDTVTVTIDVSHPNPGNAPGFQVELNDLLPAKMNFAGNLALGSCANLPDTPLSQIGSLITVGWDSFPTGGSCSFSFDITIAASANAGETIQNCSDIQWQSLNDPEQIFATGANPLAVERTGDPADAGDVANTYKHQSCADFIVTAVGLQKTISQTSQAHTGTAEHNNAITDLTIGEEITYQIVATLPEGDIPQLIITDIVPFGSSVLELLSATVTSVGANISLPSGSPTAVISDAQLGDGINDTAVLDFGSNIMVQADNLPQNDADRIFVEVLARVKNLPINQDANDATNNALVQFGPGLSGSASAAAELVEPNLVLHKMVDQTTADAGDPLSYSLIIEHAPDSTADAFFVDLSDVLPAGLNFVGSLAVGTCNLPPTVGPSENSGTITASWNSFPLGSSCEITFVATPDISVTPGQQLNNTVTGNWASLDAFELDDSRIYSANAQVAVVISRPGINKNLFSTDNIDTSAAEKGPADDLTIGETAIYQIEVTFKDGTSPGVVVTDTLPGNTSILEYVSSEIVAIGADLSFSIPHSPGDPGDACLPNCDANLDTFRDLAVWDLGDVVNQPDAISGPNPDDILILQVTAVVIDNPANSGAPGTDENQVNLAEMKVAAETFSSLYNIDIVEPLLGITKTALPANGQVVDGATPDVVYELIITHAANSTADAYELSITDILNPNTFWVNDLTVSTDCPNFSIVTSPTPGLSGMLEFAIGQLPKVVTQCSIQYTVDINDALPIVGNFPNSAQLQWDSMPQPASGRQGTDQATGLIISLANAQITKTAVSTNVAETLQGAGTDAGDAGRFDLTIGEQVVYDVVMTFNEGTTSNVILDDVIQDDANGRMEIIAATVTSVGADITTTLPGTLVGSLPANSLMMDFGNVTNLADVAGQTNDTITVQVVGRMINAVENIDDNNTLNTSQLNFETGLNRVDTELVNTVLPDIQLTKSMAAPVDNVIVITLQLENTGTAPAYDIVVSDSFDETLYQTLSGLEVLTPAGFAFSQNSVGGFTNIRFDLNGDPLTPTPDQILMPGETLQIQFSIVVLDGDQPLSTSLDNTATADYSSLPGPSPVEGSYQTDAMANLLLPSLDLTKAWNGANNPALPGDTITFNIGVNNTGEADANNIIILDVPDALGSFNAGSVISTHAGVVITGNTPGDASIEVNIATLPFGETAIISYTVTIPNPWPIAPQMLVNQALVDSDEFTSGITDWPVDPGTEDPTIVDILADPVLTLSKTDFGATAIAGQPLVYTLNYANIGNQNTAGVVITETVPLHTSFSALASLPTIWSCTDGASAGSICQTTIGLLNAGDSGAVQFGLTVVDPIPAAVFQIDNAASITDDGNQSDNGQPVTASAIEDTPINGQPGLSISKDDGGISTFPGGLYHYTLVFQNTGEQDLTGIEITETVPAFTTFSAAVSTPGWSCTNGSPAGTTCIFTIGNLDAGLGGAVDFGLQVISPLPSGIDLTLNIVNINDDGNSTEAGVIADQDQDTTPIIALPDLSVVKDDGGIPNAQPGSIIVYNLNWSLGGNQNTENVVVTETVPVGTTYSAANSLPDVWTCADGSPAGSVCQLTLGALNVGQNGNLNFAVLVDNPLPPGVNEAMNTTSITDGGINGPDPSPGNNVSTVVTPLILEPPVGRKSGHFDQAGNVIVWEMIWFNPNNTSDLPVLVLDEMPAGATFNSVDCVPTGSSSCTAIYNPVLNRIEVSSIISPDFGAPNDAPEVDLNNEIKIILTTDNIQAGNHITLNQAEACWDYNNSGSAEDDYLGGQVCIPVEASVGTAIPIPLFDHWGRLLSILLILISGLLLIRTYRRG